MHIRIATRRSRLAVWQAKHVAAKLQALAAVDSVELIELSTRGDEILDRSLQKIGGKGLFVKELEIAMQDGRADLAVHSMKDVPADMPEGFAIAAILERANERDALVSGGVAFDELPAGAVVGSSSLRRQAQLRRLRPDIEIRPLRGNVDTRLARLDAGALERLGMRPRISATFGPDEMLPAAAQGVIGVECLDGNSALKAVIAPLNHADTVRTTLAEREVTRLLGASCRSPVAAHAVLAPGALRLTALAALPDGSRHVRAAVSGPPDDGVALGAAAAEQLRAQGADEVLARARTMME